MGVNTELGSVLEEDKEDVDEDDVLDGLMKPTHSSAAATDREKREEDVEASGGPRKSPQSSSAADEKW